jgi:hypothetical protein
MLKNTLQLKSKLERFLVTGAPFSQVKSEEARECASVIKVVAQESIVGVMHARTNKKEGANRRES